MKILVVGFYNKGNFGDNLMRQALASAFSSHGVEPTFVDKISSEDLVGVDGVAFGGGSILGDDPVIDERAARALCDRVVPVFYVGVGAETSVSALHNKLLRVARVVAYRERDIADLAFLLPYERQHVDAIRDVLFVPNIEVVPTWADPHWKHASWDRFKDETAQALDSLLDSGLSITFLSLCSNSMMDDTWVANEITSRMKRRQKLVNVEHANKFEDARRVFDFSRVVVTQRYHGIIASEAVGTRYVSIDHHDKLKNATPRRGTHVSYYQVTKDMLLRAVNEALVSGKLEPHVVSHDKYDATFEEIVRCLFADKSVS